MEQDPMSRVACETATTYRLGSGNGRDHHKSICGYSEDCPRYRSVRSAIPEAKYGFDADTCGVITAIDEQSTDIAMGVDKALEAKENLMSDDRD